MPSGLQLLDGQGNLTLDLTTRTGRFLGYVDTNAARTGTASIPGVSNGSIFWLVQQISDTGDGGDINGAVPSISINGSTLSWDYETIPSPLNHRIYFGVY